MNERGQKGDQRREESNIEMLIAVRIEVVVAQNPVISVSKAATACTGYRQLVGWCGVLRR
jgi:hypothetical protein